ncbi:MAG: hypothetical protein BWY52_01244 [Chloroflexi bacterium ADurb.Bin325]|nr:MAG: hypothetical protein BWY52_01244 [Chloroflexi bacterium ADurb.Bin325]
MAHHTPTLNRLSRVAISVPPTPKRAPKAVMPSASGIWIISTLSASSSPPPR